jgi:serine/threonine protein kinase
VLTYLHQNEIVFRDLKPENILLDRKGAIKLCDFGLAKFCPRESDTFTFCGTAPYSAPEVASREGHSHEADLYSLGVILRPLLEPSDPASADFLAQLLCEKTRRAEAPALQQHPWFGSLTLRERT